MVSDGDLCAFFCFQRFLFSPVYETYYFFSVFICVKNKHTVVVDYEVFRLILLYLSFIAFCIFPFLLSLTISLSTPLLSTLLYLYQYPLSASSVAHLFPDPPLSFTCFYLLHTRLQGFIHRIRTETYSKSEGYLVSVCSIIGEFEQSRWRTVFIGIIVSIVVCLNSSENGAPILWMYSEGKM